MNTPPIIAVIGAGPAGLSASLWLKNLGLTPVVIERESLTGGMQNVNFLKNDWVLGQVDTSGLSMAECYRQHIENKSIDIHLQTDISAISRANKDKFLLSLEKNNKKSSLECEGMLIASGTRYVDQTILSQQVRRVAGECIIEGPYAFVDIEKQQNKKILIVGAGDNAFENADMLLQQGCSVVVIARSVPRTQRKFLDRVQGHPRATVVENATLCAAEKSQQGGAKTETLTLTINYQSPSSSTEQHKLIVVAVDRIHILAGYQANTDSLRPLISSGLDEFLACDQNQFLQVDRWGRTNISRIYAAGDICNTDFPCVVSAISSGALAAKTISQDLLR